MALTKLDPNVIGQDSTGTGKITSAGGSVSIDSSGNVRIANSSANNITFLANGIVGIGTNTPISSDGGNSLELSNSNNTILTLTATNDTTPAINFRSNSVNRLQIQSSSNWGAYFLVRSNQDMRFGTNNTLTAVISANGNMGVGNTAPAEKLHVQTTGADNTLLRLTAETGQAGVKMYAGSGATNRATRIDFFNGVASTSTPRWVLINDYDQNGTNDFQIVDASLNKNFVIKQGGAAGIGNSSPSHKLSVNGNAYFSSTLFTNGVRGTGSYDTIKANGGINFHDINSPASDVSDWVNIGPTQADNPYPRLAYKIAQKSPGNNGTVVYQVWINGDANYYYGGLWNIAINSWYGSDRDSAHESVSVRCVHGYRTDLTVYAYNNTNGIWITSGPIWGHIYIRKFGWDDGSRSVGATYCAVDKGSALASANATSLSGYTSVQADSGWYIEGGSAFNG